MASQFRLIAAAILSAATIASPSLCAQTDSTASIRGTAGSALNGHPLAGVQISSPATHQFAVTDSSGRFELSQLPAGPQRIRVSYGGRDADEHVFELKRGNTKVLAVLLDVDAVDLAPVVVEEQPPETWLDLAGFYARRIWYKDAGRFFSREDIEQRHARSLEDVLAWDGILTRCVQGGCVPTRARMGRLCVVPVKIDGIPFYETDARFNEMLIGDVAAVEIYESNSWKFAPTAFPTNLNYRDAGALLRTCGTALVWTR
jgi:hypothetical protein